MSEVARITITLTTEMAQLLRGAVEGGDYASSSEIVREALRDWRYKRQLKERRLEQLRSDIRDGLDDVEAGRVRDFDAERIVRKGRERLDHSSSE